MTRLPLFLLAFLPGLTAAFSVENHRVFLSTPVSDWPKRFVGDWYVLTSSKIGGDSVMRREYRRDDTKAGILIAIEVMEMGVVHVHEWLIRVWHFPLIFLLFVSRTAACPLFL